MKPAWLICAAAGSSLAIFNYFQDSKEKVKASWTTKFEPSVKWDYNWDRREPSSTVKPKRRSSSESNKENKPPNEAEAPVPTASRHLFFIRHGQYNLNGLTDADCKLTELGRIQANYAGLRLKELASAKLNFTRMVQSSLTRAQETAGIIHKHLPNLPLETCEMLREGAPIPPEPSIGGWRPEAEQFFQDGARIEAAFRKYFYRASPDQKADSYEIFVCHANVIRYFVCRALQLPPEAWARFALRHCSITRIVIRPSGRVVMISVGDHGHIPPDKIS